MSDVTAWSPTDASNNAAPPDGFPEGMPASTVNDAARATMGGVRRQAEEGGWFDWGHAATFVSGTVFQVPGDLSAIYLPGRRVRATQTATITGAIDSVNVSANTDVTVTWDSGALVNEALAVALGPEQSAVLSGSFGTAAVEDVGTGIGDVVQLENVGGNAGMPAVDGSQLTGVSGSIELLDEQTAANSATIEFVNAAWFATTFVAHRVVYSGIIPATAGANLWLRYSQDGGSTWNAGASEYTDLGVGKFSDGADVDIFDAQDRHGVAGLLSAANAWLSGDSWIYDLAEASLQPRIVSNAVWRDSAARSVGNSIWCQINATGVSGDGIQILMNTGLIASGTFRLYGLRA